MTDKQSQDILAKLDAAHDRICRVCEDQKFQLRASIPVRESDDDIALTSAIESAIAAIRERDERIAELQAKLDSLVDPDQPRPTVRWFAGLMEQQMQEIHDNEKLGCQTKWRHQKLWQLQLWMEECDADLQRAINDAAAAQGHRRNPPDAAAMRKVIRESVELACSALMIADVAAHSAGDIECAEDGEQ